ncbi:hypothetical protein MOQ_003195 [Trypanosoma cruzi marinkellei]|uniref:Uncharacterized protein n=1 Tax=Trypanosoma cruzi marinkellei TaxID=85056 RepID=K2N0L0_TRYCR|nr:hypothetical protein MOQ_003195 [Trypanosoma cruzi marinkellei]
MILPEREYTSVSSRSSTTTSFPSSTARTGGIKKPSAAPAAAARARTTRAVEGAGGKMSDEDKLLEDEIYRNRFERLPREKIDDFFGVSAGIDGLIVKPLRPEMFPPMERFARRKGILATVPSLVWPSFRILLLVPDTNDVETLAGRSVTWLGIGVHTDLALSGDVLHRDGNGKPLPKERACVRSDMPTRPGNQYIYIYRRGGVFQNNRENRKKKKSKTKRIQIGSFQANKYMYK